jgi:hypothetical protein
LTNTIAAFNQTQAKTTPLRNKMIDEQMPMDEGVPVNEGGGEGMPMEEGGADVKDATKYSNRSLEELLSDVCKSARIAGGLARGIRSVIKKLER